MKKYSSFPLHVMGKLNKHIYLRTQSKNKRSTMQYKEAIV